MRLVCPNCDAQYEVDDAAIPDGGRDVQCSNCGHAWFQLPPDLADKEEDAAEAALFQSPPPALPPAAEAPAPPAAPVPPPPALTPEAEDDGDDAPAAPPPLRRTLDESVLAVLREEAEREAAARRAEGARGVEMQPDLGLTAPVMAAKAVAEPAAPVAHVTAEIETQPPVTTRPGARRDLLPDIEEINSTLRAGSEARDMTPEETQAAVAARSGGFRAGFGAVVVLAVVLVALYVLAPRIAQHLPGSAAAMETYVVTVDGARIWLDGAMQGAVTWLRGLTGQGG